MAKLYIERTLHGYVDRWRSYEVIVNGKPRGELGRGEATMIEVDPGEVEMYMKIDWCRSRILRMTLDPGAEIRLLCRPRSIFTAFYGITFGRNNYVQLEHA
jgi:hypothetical protein